HRSRARKRWCCRRRRKSCRDCRRLSRSARVAEVLASAQHWSRAPQRRAPKPSRTASLGILRSGYSAHESTRWLLGSEPRRPGGGAPTKTLPRGGGVSALAPGPILGRCPAELVFPAPPLNRWETAMRSLVLRCAAATAVSLVWCAPATAQRSGQSISIQYGVVAERENVELSAAAGGGALGGGLAGV